MTLEQPPNTPPEKEKYGKTNLTVEQANIIKEARRRLGILVDMKQPLGALNQLTQKDEYEFVMDIMYDMETLLGIKQ